ncbi:hypothetical protein ACVWW4_002489 [Bradyrhizobium sp. LB7.1]
MRFGVMSTSISSERFGIDLVHALHEAGQPGVHDSFGNAETHHTAHRRAVADLGQHLGAQADQFFRIHHHLPAARRRRSHAMIAVEELHAHLALKLGDSLGDRRLGRVEPCCGAAEAAELHNPEERLDRPEVQH